MAVSQSELRAILSIQAQGVQVLGQVEAALGRLGATSRTAGSSFSSMAGAMTLGSVAANAITGAITSTVGAMVGAGKGALDLSSRLEQARIGFTTMLGSAQKADQFIGQLQQKAESTAFSFPGIQQVAQSFLAMGVEAKNVIPLIDDVSNALSAAGHGGDTDRLQRVGQSLSEIAAQGKISGEQIRELSRNGIAVLPLLAEAFGKTAAEVRKMAESGEISAEMFFTAFHSEVALHYGDIQAQQAKTWAVAASNVGDILGRLSTETLAEFFAALTNGALILNDFLHSEQAAVWANNFKAAIHEVMTALAPLVALLAGSLGLPTTLSDAAAAPKFKPPPATFSQANWQDTAVPPAVLKSADDYTRKIAAAKVELHGITVELNANAAAQTANANAADAVRSRYAAQLVGLHDQQEANNLAIEATKTKYEAILEPLNRMQAQLQRLGEDTKNSFAAILDPLKLQLDDVNRKISDSKLAYEATVKPIQAQIAAIDKATAALTKQREIQGQIADIALRAKALDALGDPNQRADIAGGLKRLELARDLLQNQMDQLELANNKGSKDKEIAAVQAKLDANKQSELELQRQLFGLVDQGATAQIAHDEVLLKNAADRLQIDKDRAALAAEQAKAPLQDRLDAAEASLKAALDPLEAQQTAIARTIEDVARIETATLAPIIAAQEATARKIEDANTALADAIKPLETASKALAAQITAAEAAEKRELAPILAAGQDLDRQQAVLEERKKKIQENIDAWGDEVKKIKEAADEVAKIVKPLDLSSGEKPGARPGDANVDSEGRPAPTGPLVQFPAPPSGLAAAIQTLTGIVNAHAVAWATVSTNMAAAGVEWDKLAARVSGGKGIQLITARDINDIVTFGAQLSAVVANSLDAINTLGEAFSAFGTGLQHTIQANKLAAQGDWFGALEEAKIAGAAFRSIPDIIAAEQARALARSTAAATVIVDQARDNWGGYVSTVDLALQPLGPTVEEAVANGVKILPKVTDAVVAEKVPLADAAKALGEQVQPGLDAGVDATVTSLGTKVPELSKAIDDHDETMLAAANTLGSKIPLGLGTGLDDGKPAVEKNIGDWLLDVVKKFDPLYKLFLWFEEHWPGQKVPANAGQNVQMALTAFRPGQDPLRGVMGDGGVPSQEALNIMRTGGVSMGNELISAIADTVGGRGNPIIENAIIAIVNAAIANGIDPLIALAVSKGESSFNPAAHNPSSKEDSWGLFQHNRAGGQGTGIPVEVLIDPVFNAQKFLSEHAALFKQLSQQFSGPELAAQFGGQAEVSQEQFWGRYADTFRELAPIWNAAVAAGAPLGDLQSFLLSSASPLVDAQAQLASGTAQVTTAQNAGAQADAVAAAAKAKLTQTIANGGQVTAGAVAPTNALGAAQQGATNWTKVFADQAAYLALIMQQQVPAGMLTAADSMKLFGSTLGPIERDIAAGRIQIGTLEFKLLDLARATGLNTAAWERFNSGAEDSSAAMSELIDSTADLSPAFKAVAAYQHTAGADSIEAALRWFQAAKTYNEAKAALAASPVVPPVPPATANSVTAVGTNWDEVKGKADAAGISVKTYQDIVNALDAGKITEQTDALTTTDDALNKLSDDAHSFADWLDGHVFEFHAKFPDIPADFQSHSPPPLQKAFEGIGKSMLALNRIRGVSILGLNGARSHLTTGLPLRPALGFSGPRLSMASLPPSGGSRPSGDVNITIVDSRDPDATARAVRDVLIKHGRRNGGKILD